MKYFIFSIDDGTIYDRQVSEIFSKYNIKATFNLNSGLQHYVWYKDNRPVERLDLVQNKDVYVNHEVASHSFTHPYLTGCSDEQVYSEAKVDIDNLSYIFNRDIVTFAFPFDNYDDRTISIIRSIKPIKLIRISCLDDSFKMPSDRYHIKATSWDIGDALDKFNRFVEDDSAELFIFVAHSYDFEFANTYDKLERLCELVTSRSDIKIIPMSGLIDLIKE